MKRILLSLILAITVLPKISTAQSTPSVIGKMSWTFNNPLTLGSVPILTQVCQPAPGACPVIIGLGPVCPPGTSGQICSYVPKMSDLVLLQSIDASVTDPQNGLTHYSLTGVANAVDGQSIPITGAMTLSDSSYLMTISIIQYTLSCTLATSTLNGACINPIYPSTPYSMTFQ